MPSLICLDMVYNQRPAKTRQFMSMNQAGWSKAMRISESYGKLQHPCIL